MKEEYRQRAYESFVTSNQKSYDEAIEIYSYALATLDFESVRDANKTLSERRDLLRTIKDLEGLTLLKKDKMGKFYTIFGTLNGQKIVLNKWESANPFRLSNQPNDEIIQERYSGEIDGKALTFEQARDLTNKYQPQLQNMMNTAERMEEDENKRIIRETRREL